MSYFYFTELCKVDPSLKSRSDLEFSSISSLLNLMQNKVLDVSFLERMSNDLNWNYQEVLVTQVIVYIYIYIKIDLQHIIIIILMCILL